MLLAQSSAVTQWIQGKDRRSEVSQIRVPALVADGTMDALDPVQNASLLAAAIKDAKVHLYPDAGHAFLFQDYTRVRQRGQCFSGLPGQLRAQRGEGYHRHPRCSGLDVREGS